MGKKKYNRIQKLTSTNVFSLIVKVFFIGHMLFTLAASELHQALGASTKNLNEGVKETIFSLYMYNIDRYSTILFQVEQRISQGLWYTLL